MVSTSVFLHHGMFLVLTDFDFVIAFKVWTFDGSLRASGLVLLYLLQIVLDLALTVLAWVRNSLNHLVGDGVCSVLEHLSSACWTRGHVPNGNAVFTSDVPHWTGGNGNLPGDQETHGTLELVRDIIHFVDKKG